MMSDMLVLWRRQQNRSFRSNRSYSSEPLNNVRQLEGQAADRAARSRASIPNRQWAPSRWRPRDIHPERLRQVLCSYTSDNRYRDTDRLRFVQTVDDLHLAPKTCTPQWGSIRCKPVSRHNQCSSLWLSRECVVASFAPLYRRLQTSANVFLRCRTSVFRPLFVSCKP